MTIADSTVNSIIGKITPPPGPSQLYGDPIVGIGKLFGTFLNLFMLFAGVALLVYLLWGGVDWVMSGGDKEALGKAQMKITHALIGMLWIVVGITLFGLITGNILGIIKHTPAGWQFDIPRIKPGCGGTCRDAGSCKTPEMEDNTQACADVDGKPQVCCNTPPVCNGSCERQDDPCTGGKIEKGRTTCDLSTCGGLGCECCVK